MKLSELVNKIGYSEALKAVGRNDLSYQYLKYQKITNKVLKYNGIRPFKERPNKIKARLKIASKAFSICSDFIFDNRHLEVYGK